MTTWISGTCLGLALAIVIAAGSAAAGDKLGTGMTCSRDTECESRYCKFGKCLGTNGSEKLGTGMTCSRDTECESGYCKFGKCKGKS